MQDPARRLAAVRGGRGGAGRRRRRAALSRPARGTTRSTAIPGVIAAGQQWKFLWQEAGNNGDGIVGTNDGGLLLAQNDNSKVVKLDKDGKTSVVYSDTHTGGALSMNSKGALFIVERGCTPIVTQLAPQRKVLADSYQGDPLDCIGGVINDLTADSKGGVYFTMGGVYYASPKGVVTKYGENVTPNGIILSANEKIALRHQRPDARGVRRPAGRLADQPARVRQARGRGGGDGSTIDAAGRIYVTTNAGVQVIGPDGKYLGTDSDAARRHHRGVRRQGQEDAVHPRARRQGCERRRSRQRRAGVGDPDDRAGLQGPREVDFLPALYYPPTACRGRVHLDVGPTSANRFQTTS